MHSSHNLDASVVNLRRCDFAKGIGLDAKTDPIDARVISRYAEVVMPKPNVHGDPGCDSSQPNDQSLLCSLEVERKRIQGRDCCMFAQARDGIEPTCKVKSDMANKMSDAID